MACIDECRDAPCAVEGLYDQGNFQLFFQNPLGNL